MPNPKELTYAFVDDDKAQADGMVDGDYVIHDPPSGLLHLCIHQGPYIGTFPDANSICQAIRTHMVADQFWPNVWHINERGTVDLCQIIDVWPNNPLPLEVSPTRATKTEAEITEQLKSDGWALSSALVDPGSPNEQSSWSVTISRTIPTFGGQAVGGYLEPQRGRQESFPTIYHKGAAHRRWKKGGFGVLPLGCGTWRGLLPKAPKAGETVPQLHGRRSLMQQELLETCTEPEPPTLDEVLWSLLMDSSGIRHGQTFEDWCGDCGSDPDSIKARKTFDACRDEWAALIRLGADFDALEVLFQDY